MGIMKTTSDGIPVVVVENEEDFLNYLGERPMECPPGMAEKFGFTDEISPAQLHANLAGEREWQELQEQRA